MIRESHEEDSFVLLIDGNKDDLRSSTACTTLHNSPLVEDVKLGDWNQFIALCRNIAIGM